MATLPKRVRDQLDRMDTAFDRIDAVLLRLGVQGLQRASRGTADELRALHLVAHSAGLITIARALEALATLVTRYLDRDPVFAMGAYTDAINRIWLINRAARSARAAGRLPAEMLDLIGQARRTFAPVDGPLVVQTVGAWGWVTDSGFVGATLYLRCDGQSEPLLINNARPTLQFGADPEAVYGMALHPDLGLTAADMAHRAWTLHGAKRSADGRLSMHGGLRIEDAAFRGAEAWRGFGVPDWAGIIDRLRAADASPIRRADGALVYLEPADLGVVTTDRTHAVARGTFSDAAGATLNVHIPARRENNTWIDNLERITRGKAARPQGWFGKAWVQEDELRFAPYTAVYATRVNVARRRDPVHTVHLSLERLVR